MAVALGVAAYQTIRWAEGPAVPAEEHPASKVIVIPDGSTFQQVAMLLEREGLIKSRTFFVYFGKSQSADRKVHAGEYELNPGMTPTEILAMLLNGHVLLHPLTIPEGLTILQIADLAWSAAEALGSETFCAAGSGWPDWTCRRNSSRL